MPRPPKKRYVCCMPKHEIFSPQNPVAAEPVVLTVDEYETIRLIDLQGDTQEECAAQMLVSRTTVQSVYNNARRKIADALVNGKTLTIAGGDYIVCPHHGKQCANGCKRRCPKHDCHFEKTED